MLDMADNPATQINKLQDEIAALKSDLQYYKDGGSYGALKDKAQEGQDLQNDIDNGELIHVDNMSDWLCEYAHYHDYVHVDHIDYDGYVDADTYREAVDMGKEAKTTLDRIEDMCQDTGCGCTSQQEWMDIIIEAQGDLSSIQNY